MLLWPGKTVAWSNILPYKKIFAVVEKKVGFSTSTSFRFYEKINFQQVPIYCAGDASYLPVALAQLVARGRSGMIEMDLWPGVPTFDTYMYWGIEIYDYVRLWRLMTRHNMIIYKWPETPDPWLTFSSVHCALRRESWRSSIPWKRQSFWRERNCQLSGTRKKGRRIWGEANARESMFTNNERGDYGWG